METEVAVLLGFIQGLTEFLPVSSSGHLLAARLLFNISDVGGVAVDAFLHLGTLVAVLLYFWPVWWGIIRGLITNDAESRDKRELAAKLAIATVPAAIAGYLLQSAAEQLFRNATTLSVSLLLTAAALWWFDRDNQRTGTIHRASYKDATIIGLAQIVALLPGISRSGITIAAGRARGLSRRQAARFSFLMSAPIIAGAGLNSFAALLTSPGNDTGALLAGFVTALISGLAAIHFLLKLVDRISFRPFAVYLVALAIVILIYVQ